MNYLLPVPPPLGPHSDEWVSMVMAGLNANRKKRLAIGIDSRKVGANVFYTDLPILQDFTYRKDSNGWPWRTSIWPKRQRKAVLWVRWHVGEHGTGVFKLLDRIITQTTSRKGNQ